MKQQPRFQKAALQFTRWIGSPNSIIIHTGVFILAFLAVLAGLIEWNDMLLFLTTIVSLEAIYLSLFIQMTVNFTTESLQEVEHDIDEIQEDVGEIQEDIDELQEDVEEIAEEEESEEQAEEARKAAQQKTLGDIQSDLRKLMNDIEKLQQPRDFIS